MWPLCYLATVLFLKLEFSFNWSYFKYPPHSLPFIISCSLFQQMTDLKERNLDSTNLLNLPESTPGLSSLVSFHQHPQKLYSPLSFVSRPLASFLTTIPFESYSPAALDFLHLEMCACASVMPALLLHGMNYLSLKSQMWPPT